MDTTVSLPVTLPVTLPAWRGPADPAPTLLTREVAFTRVAPGRWRSLEACFVATLEGPYAEAIHHRALELTERDSRPGPIPYARPLTGPGCQAAEAQRRLGRRCGEIRIRIGDQDARIFGWAEGWPRSTDGRFHEESIGPMDTTPPLPPLPAAYAPPAALAGLIAEARRRPATPPPSAPRSGELPMPPVVARSLSAWGADLEVIFWDIETTGLIELDLDRHIVGPVPEIWQLGFLSRTTQGGSQAATNVILRGERLSPRLARLSGVDADLPLGGVDPYGALLDFDALTDGRLLIGHNSALYDEPVLRAAYERRDLEVPLSLLAPVTTLDTLPLARALLPKGDPGSPERHNLATLAAHFGIPPGAAHTAAADALVTARIWDELLVIAIERWGGVEQALGQARRSDTARHMPELYGWVANECPICHRRRWEHSVYEKPCDACREAAKRYTGTCSACGEEDRSEWPVRPGWLCSMCWRTDKQAKEAAAAVAR